MAVSAKQEGSVCGKSHLFAVGDRKVCDLRSAAGYPKLRECDPLQCPARGASAGFERKARQTLKGLAAPAIPLPVRSTA